MSLTVPQIRFPGFTGRWQIKKLGKIAEFSKGASISKNDIHSEGKTEAIRYGELYTEYKEVIKSIKSRTNLPPDTLTLSKANDIVVPASGETHIDIATAACVLLDNVALSGDINIVRTDNNGVFMAYYLSNKKRNEIARVAQGVSVIHLYKSGLQDLNLNLPDKTEQEKIAGFLTVIDERIELIEKRVELLKKYKQGIMQKVFSQKLRFKDKNNNDYPAWQAKNLAELAQFLRGLTYRSSDVALSGNLVLRSSNIQGGKLVLNKDLQFVSKNVPANIGLQKNDIVICMSNGSKKLVGKTGVYDGSYDGELTVGAFCSICRGRSEILPYLFQISQYRKYLHILLSGTNINNLNNSDLETLTFLLPTEDAETRKIAHFLRTIDDKIELEEAKSEQAKVFKKALLQRMFV